MITHIPIRIDSGTYILTTERDRAYSVSRVHGDEIELLWVAPPEPGSDARDVLGTAGYSITAPYGRIA